MLKLGPFGPAVASASPIEAVRAGLGAFIGLGLAGVFVLSAQVDLVLGLYLVAPFGATAVLLFAVPNSPLAQPWSAIVGNMVAAVVAIAVCQIINDPMLRIALAVGLAIVATILCRALHPPAGAVAMTAALSPNAVQDLGFMFALTPIALGTTILVLVAIAYGRLTGRHYPFRQYDEPTIHDTTDKPPTERLGLSEDDLADILERYHQSFNLGVEDLARLISASQMKAVGHTTGDMTAADVMSRNVITVGSKTRLRDVADLFIHHTFTALPVVEGRAYRGIIFQLHLINSTKNVAHSDRFISAMRKLLVSRHTALRAGDIMSTKNPRATPTTPVAALLPLMADGEVDAVPVLEQDQLVGIVTRTDLISALARLSLMERAHSV